MYFFNFVIIIPLYSVLCYKIKFQRTINLEYIIKNSKHSFQSSTPTCLKIMYYNADTLFTHSLLSCLTLNWYHRSVCMIVNVCVLVCSLFFVYLYVCLDWHSHKAYPKNIYKTKLYITFGSQNDIISY